MDSGLMAETIERLDAVAPEEEIDQASLRFWLSQVRQPSEESGSILQAHTKSPKGRPPATGAPATQPAFVYYDAKEGFKDATSLKEDGLPDKGNINVALRVTKFHPSRAAQENFVNLKTGSLRIDLQQVNPLPRLAEALAWTAVGAIMPTAKGKLPELQSLQFDPGTSWGKSQTVPLPGGLGFWTWNFFLQRQDGLWGQLIKMFHQGSEQIFPILGLPAIAITALKSTDALLGYLQARRSTDWIFQSVDIPVYGTKAARDAFLGWSVQLRSGTYLVIPQAQVSQLHDGLELQQGLIVPRGTRELGVFDAAQRALPDMTYLSVSVIARAD